MDELVPFIDWTPFFRAWELHGKYPNILTDKVVGTQATELFEDAQKMLDQIVNEKWLKASGVAAIWKANRIEDDIEVELSDGSITKFHTLRQQSKKAGSASNLALADFIAPKDSGIPDHIGGFAVTTGHGIKEHIDRFEKDHDDYNSIMLKALADRLAEAFAEFLHKKIRTETWGYGKG